MGAPWCKLHGERHWHGSKGSYDERDAFAALLRSDPMEGSPAWVAREALQERLGVTPVVERNGHGDPEDHERNAEAETETENVTERINRNAERQRRYRERKKER